MVLCSRITQIEIVYPSLQGQIVGQGQFPVGMLQIFQQLSIVDGDGCLTGQGFQEVKSFGIRVERLAKVDFQNATKMLFDYQWRGEIFCEIFFFPQVGQS